MPNLRTANTRRHRALIMDRVRICIDRLVQEITAEGDPRWAIKVNGEYVEYEGDPDLIPKNERYVQYRKDFLLTYALDDTWRA